MDLFCGVGGLSLGAERAGYDIVLAADSDPLASSYHSRNFPNGRTLTIDLSLTDGGSLLRAAGLKAGDLDLLIAGPPCQGFSLGGKRVEGDPRNSLLLDLARLIGEIRPKYFVVENVDGLASPTGWPTLSRFVNRIRQGGYRIVDPIQILDASNYGVPQRRKRMLVLGHLSQLQAPTYPEPYAETHPTVWDAISDLPLLSSNQSLLSVDRYEGDLGTPSDYAASLRTRSASADGGTTASLGGCLMTAHAPHIVERFSATAPGSREPISRFYRLAKSSVAPTLRAGSGPDQGSFTAPRPIHPDEPRCITVREAARLHSFPDWFEFHPTRWHGFRQVGNSVPPRLAEAICRSVQTAAIGGKS